MTWRKPIAKFIRREIGIWRVAALPGLILVALVILVRLTGGLQRAEWFALDTLLRLRPAELVDRRILIVGIDEEDLSQLQTYPVPDRQLASLIEKLEQHQPAAIGLDIFRDLPVEPGHAELVRVFQSSPNLVGIEKVIADPSTVKPPPALPSDRVGFADAVLDSDGFLRRSLLGTSTRSGDYRFSLTLRLAERYLAKQQIPLENGIRDPIAFRFGAVELPRFSPNEGGYVNADAGGNQVLLHYRAGVQPFQIVTLRDVMQGRVPDQLIRDRIILIGMTANSVKDVVNVAGVQGRESRLVNGVEVQAHAISQIISAVLDRRPFLSVWANHWEFVWIGVWGLVGIALGRLIRSPLKLLLGVGIGCTLLVGICYGMLLLGWWLPLVPALLCLSLTGAGLTTLAFYRYHQDLEARLHDRQLVIDRTFDAIHNGPLQTLASLMQQVQTQSTMADPLHSHLRELNRELRAVYESVRQEVILEDDRFYLDQSLELDLTQPLHELLYEVYACTLNRDFPGFQTLKLNITTFEPLDERFLTADHKRGLCRFLEEALCNVGKHGIGVTQLEVMCRFEAEQNIIRVIDNGKADNRTVRNEIAENDIAKNSTLNSETLEHGAEETSDYFLTADDRTNQNKSNTCIHPIVGRGTRQAKALAHQLGGTFQRSFNPPQGVLCELVWSADRANGWNRILRRISLLPKVKGN